MNLIKNVIASIISKKVKYLILLFIFFLLGNFLIVAIGISDASSSAISISRQKLNPVIVLENNKEGYSLDNSKLQHIISDKNQMLKDDRVKVYNKLYYMNLYSEKTIPVPMENDEYKYSKSYDGMQLVCNNTTSMIEIFDGTYEIVEGRFYNQQEIDNDQKVILVTKEFAQLNNLELYDTISFTTFADIDDMQKYFDNDFDGYIEFEIIGIFENNESTYGKKYMDVRDYPQNTMLAPFSAIEHYEDISSLASTKMMNDVKNLNDEITYFAIHHYENINPIIKLNDPNDLEQYVTEYQEKLNPYFILNSNNDAFLKYGKPLDIITYFADFLLMFVLINMVIMISTIICIFVKMREIEIGILLSMGIRKFNIILQMFIEVIIIGFIGISLSFFTGKIIAQKYGSEVLSLSVVQDNIVEDEQKGIYSFGNEKDYFENIDQQDIFENFQVNISSDIIIKIYLLSTIIVFISSLIPSLLIMIFDPNKILSHKD